MIFIYFKEIYMSGPMEIDKWPWVIVVWVGVFLLWCKVRLFYWPDVVELFLPAILVFITDCYAWFICVIKTDCWMTLLHLLGWLLMGLTLSCTRLYCCVRLHSVVLDCLSEILFQFHCVGFLAYWCRALTKYGIHNCLFR